MSLCLQGYGRRLHCYMMTWGGSLLHSPTDLINKTLYHMISLFFELKNRSQKDLGFFLQSGPFLPNVCAPLSIIVPNHEGSKYGDEGEVNCQHESSGDRGMAFSPPRYHGTAPKEKRACNL